MPTEIPTDIPTTIPEDMPAVIPGRKTLREPLVSALGHTDGDDTIIAVYDMPDRTKVEGDKIMTRAGKRPFCTWVHADGTPDTKIPIFHSTLKGLYFDNQEFLPGPGDILVCKRLSPQYTVRNRPIAGFSHVFH